METASLGTGVTAMTWSLLGLLLSAAPCTSTNAKPCTASCKAGDATACLTLGAALLAGTGGLKADGRAAVVAWDTGCSAGSGASCAAAARVMFGKVGNGAKPDVERALAWNLKGCALGFADSCTEAGNSMLFSDLVARNEAEGVVLITRACELKETFACNALASFFEDGSFGVAKNAAKALSLRVKACEAGGAEACLAMGLMYDKGQGAEVNKPRAHALYEKACAAGSGEACLYVSIDKRTGEGTPIDLPGALAPLEKACNLKVAPACHDLSIAHYTGDGAKKDLKRAFALASEACRLFPVTMDACVNAGIMLRDGQGTRKDAKAALEKFDHACLNENERGCALAAELRGKKP